MEKDFFDEELEKKQEDEKRRAEEERQRQLNDWYGNGPADNGGERTRRQPIYIVLICVALVLMFVFGWVMCALVGGKSKETQILDTVLEYLNTEYYKDIPDSKIQEAIAAGGTAILQTAGDRYSQLMSPQQFYDYTYQSDNTVDMSGGNGYFGMSYSPYGVGWYVSSVVSDSSCYGLLESGDIILKITDMTDANGNALRDSNGEVIDEVVIADYESTDLDGIMLSINSANFRYLRDGEMYDTGVITRGKVGVENPITDLDLDFIEFYFGKNCNNISTVNQNNAKHNTYELRGLANLPSDTGYIRITQFMYYYDGNVEVTAADEFRQAMELFKEMGLKRLILDLKGNPGGRVDAVSTIASMLVTDAKLTSAQKSEVTNRDGNLKITSLVPKDERKTEYEYRASGYNQYFGNPGDICDIVIWTDENSASASELLTGALTDYGTGFQIGTRTYGKGIAQAVVPLTGYVGRVTPREGDTTTEYYWAIYYTFASYYSPLGTNIHGVGYVPTKGYNGISDYVSKDFSSTLWGATYKYWGLTK